MVNRLSVRRRAGGLRYGANLLGQAAGRGVYLAAGFAAFAMVGRFAGPAALGRYGLALAILALALIAADFGTTLTFGARLGALGPQMRAAEFGRMLSARPRSRSRDRRRTPLRPADAAGRDPARPGARRPADAARGRALPRRPVPGLRAAGLVRLAVARQRRPADRRDGTRALAAASGGGAQPRGGGRRHRVRRGRAGAGAAPRPARAPPRCRTPWRRSGPRRGWASRTPSARSTAGSA
ncbi:hypothetical protein ACU4GA_15770 [Methylobacterium oryzae CBMB20]